MTGIGFMNTYLNRLGQKGSRISYGAYRTKKHTWLPTIG